MKNSEIVLILIQFLLIAGRTSSVNNATMSQALRQNKYYLIYVYGKTHHFEIESIFNSYCLGDKICSIVDSSIPAHHQFIRSIGSPLKEYLLIISSLNKRKYIRSIINDSITYNDLLDFQNEFINNKLTPYYGSQRIPQFNNMRCSKIVGNNLEQFLRRKELLKVILMYNFHKFCQKCESILRNYIIYADSRYDSKLTAFGYFNTYLNDHPLIQDQKSPYFHIFIEGQVQNPLIIKANDLTILSSVLKEKLNDLFKRKKQQNVKQNESTISQL